MGGPEGAGERENKLGETSDLEPGGGVASGGGESEQRARARLAQEAESAAHPSGARAALQAKAGWAGGCRALDPHRDPAAPSPPPR